MAADYDTATPYIASYMILRKGNKVAFVLRSNTSWMNDYYSLPAGKVESDESYTTAAIREAKEEVGVTVKPGDFKQVLTMHRREGSDWVDVFFEATKWDGEPFNAEPDVHSELAWLDVDNFPDNVIPSVVFAFEQMKQGKQYCEYGWDD